MFDDLFFEEENSQYKKVVGKCVMCRSQATAFGRSSGEPLCERCNNINELILKNRE